MYARLPVYAREGYHIPQTGIPSRRAKVMSLVQHQSEMTISHDSVFLHRIWQNFACAVCNAVVRYLSSAFMLGYTDIFANEGAAPLPMQHELIPDELISFIPRLRTW